MNSGASARGYVDPAVRSTFWLLLSAPSVWTWLLHGTLATGSLVYVACNEALPQSEVLVAMLPFLSVAATILSGSRWQLRAVRQEMQRLQAPGARRVELVSFLLLITATSLSVVAALLLAGLQPAWMFLVYISVLAWGSLPWLPAMMPFFMVYLAPWLMHERALTAIDSILNGPSYYGVIVMGGVLVLHAIWRERRNGQPDAASSTPNGSRLAQPAFNESEADGLAAGTTSARVTAIASLGQSQEQDAVCKTEGDRALLQAAAAWSSPGNGLVALSLGDAPIWSGKALLHAFLWPSLAFALSAAEVLPITLDVCSAFMAAIALVLAVGWAEATIANVADRNCMGVTLMHLPGYPTAPVLLSALYRRVGVILLYVTTHLLVALSGLWVLTIWFDLESGLFHLKMQALAFAVFVAFAVIAIFGHSLLWLRGVRLKRFRSLPPMLGAMACIVVSALLAIGLKSLWPAVLIPVITVLTLVALTTFPKGRALQLIREPLPREEPPMRGLG